MKDLAANQVRIKVRMKNRLKYLTVFSFFIACNAWAWPWDSNNVLATQTQIPSNKPQEFNGYKGILWGTSYSASGLKKSPSGNEDENNNSNDQMDVFGLGNRGINNYLNDYFIGFVLGLPIKKDPFINEPSLVFDFSREPKTFESYGDDDDLRFIFYKKKYVMALTVLDVKNFTDYYSTLSEKYKFIQETSEKFYEQDDPDKTAPIDVTVDEFENNYTKVFLVKFSAAQPAFGVSLDFAYVLYGSKNIVNEIRGDIAKGVESEDSDSKKEEEKSKNEDLKKLE